jgi:hypothetical protein
MSSSLSDTRRRRSAPAEGPGGCGRPLFIEEIGRIDAEPLEVALGVLGEHHRAALGIHGVDAGLSHGLCAEVEDL